jgi:hypothetical protein
VVTKRLVPSEEVGTGRYDDAEGIAWTCPR